MNIKYVLWMISFILRIIGQNPWIADKYGSECLFGKWANDYWKAFNDYNTKNLIGMSMVNGQLISMIRIIFEVQRNFYRLILLIWLWLVAAFAYFVRVGINWQKNILTIKYLKISNTKNELIRCVRIHSHTFTSVSDYPKWWTRVSLEMFRPNDYDYYYWPVAFPLSSWNWERERRSAEKNSAQDVSSPIPFKQNANVCMNTHKQNKSKRNREHTTPGHAEMNIKDSPLHLSWNWKNSFRCKDFIEND